MIKARQCFIQNTQNKNIYRYSFPKLNKDERFRGSRRYSFDYKGQKQSLLIAEQIDPTQEVRVCFWDHIGYKWVEIDELLQNLHPYRQLGAKLFIEKFKSLNIN